MAKRKAVETAIISMIMDYCDEHDILFSRNHPVHIVSRGGKTMFAKVRSSEKGKADLFIFVGRVGVVACEVKSEKGVQSDDQIAWQKKWESLSRRYIVVRSLQDFVAKL